MRQLLLEKGILTVKEVFKPMLTDTTILVSVHYSCISSGTEASTIQASQKHILSSNIPQKITKVFESISKNGIDGTRALITSKLKGEFQTLGYSCSGKVIAVGKKVTQFRPGDYVACAGAQFAHHADIVCIPQNLAVKIDNPELLHVASMTTMGAIALQGVRRASVQLGEIVCVIGLGLLGQITLQLLKAAGCKVIGIDIAQERLDLAVQMGAFAVYKADDEQLINDIKLKSHFQGCDATIITAGSSSNSIMQQAMEVTRKKGKVVIVGDVGLGIERSPFYQKEIDLLISCSYGPGRYDNSYECEGIDYPYPYVRWTENRNMVAFVELLAQQRPTFEKLISQTISIDHAQEAYTKLQEKQNLCVVLSYAPKEEPDYDTITPARTTTTGTSNITYIRPSTGKIRVGIIGTGGFAKVKLIPIISRIPGVTLSAFVDPDITNALNLVKQYPAAEAYSHEQELLMNDIVDAVVIASPHKYHAEQALKFLQKGKAVLVEKPHVTTPKQLEAMTEFLKKHPSIPFCVDYNRPFAPYMTKIKEQIKKRTTPLMILYRVNAGFIPKDHWLQTDIGAGRIIGEACHMLDLFCFLTDAQPRTVSVEALQPNSEHIFPTDNFSVQISFSDGSVCSLLYTALGSKKVPKEYMELHYDSKTIIMNDFVKLEGSGLPYFFNQKSSAPDKGHEVLIQAFFKTIMQDNPTQVIPYERLYTAAQLTLLVDKLACQGGGSEQFDHVCYPLQGHKETQQTL